VTGLRCDDVRELAPAYLLDALEPDDADAVRDHLAACTEPHPELAELGGVVPYLADAIEPIEPPAALKDRIMAAAAADLAARGGAPVVSPPTAAASAAAASAVGPPADAPTQIPVPAARSRRDWARWGLAAAAVLVIGILGASNLMLRSQLDGAEAYAAAVDEVVAAAAEPGAQLAALEPAEPGGPSGIAAVRADGSVVAALSGLEPTSGTEVYTAWMLASADATPVPMGDFTVGSDGVGHLADGAGQAVPGLILAVSHEPAPSPTAPTLPILASGQARPPATPDQPA
jgi:hypothetical protein